MLAPTVRCRFHGIGGVAALSLLCATLSASAQSPQIPNIRPRHAAIANKQTKETTGAATPSAETQRRETAGSPTAAMPMSAAELFAELSGVKDNSLVIANRVISGPLKIDADQRAIMPINFKVEFRDCEFTDDVVVKRVDFGQSVKFLRVKFDQRLMFEHVSVKGDLHFDYVQSARPIQIFQSQVDGEVRIRNPVADALQIENLTAGNLIVSLGKVAIQQVDLAHLNSGRLSLATTDGVIAEIGQLKLDNVTLRETLALQNLDLQEVTAVGLTVSKRMMLLPVTTVKKHFDLTSANLGGLEWRFANQTELPERLEINGATLGTLSISRLVPRAAGPGNKSRLRADHHDYGLDFLDKAAYYEPAYAFYEAELMTRGQSDRADDVYFALRDRRRYAELRDAEGFWATTAAAFNYVVGFGHKWLFGYGRAWVYPLIWCAVLVLVGALVFRDGDRMQKMNGESPQTFSPIWYSLDLFVPILSLGLAKNWVPKEEFRLQHFYSKFLSLIGLILISAMAGALTGTLK